MGVQSKDVQHAIIPLKNLEYMVRDAIIHGVDFSQKIYTDETWQVVMDVMGSQGGATKYKAQYIYKNGQQGYIEFTLQEPNRMNSQNNMALPPELQAILNSYGLVYMTLYCENTVAIKQEVLKRAASVQHMINTSNNIHTVLELNEQKRAGSNISVVTETVKQKQPVSKTKRNKAFNGGKGLAGLFKGFKR